MPITIFQIDAFTDVPFRGNPAAVCFLPGPKEDAWMQAVAQEMNLAETAFLLPEDGDYRLRWFTPTVEVDLCGHATLASAHFLWETGRLPSDVPAQFRTRSGTLGARQGDGWIVLDFPALPLLQCDPPPELTSSLGVDPVRVVWTSADYLVEVDSEETVRQLVPDLHRLARLPCRGVIVTASSGEPGVDFVSRFFAPASGVPEDPVTGSAHCALAPFWAIRIGRQDMVGYQASPRGGTVRVSLAGDRVHLAGRAVTVMRGELLC